MVPLVFEVVIKPLESCVLYNIKIKGIMMNNNVHKISLYADDIISPEKYIPYVLSTIEQFGRYS